MQACAATSIPRSASTRKSRSTGSSPRCRRAASRRPTDPQPFAASGWRSPTAPASRRRSRRSGWDRDWRRRFRLSGVDLGARGPYLCQTLPPLSGGRPSMDWLLSHFDFVASPEAWIALVTLVVLEIVLGIDNLIFISILTNKLPQENQKLARRLGISGALILRLALLGTISFIVQLTTPVFTLFDHGFSWRDLILIAGGLFLVWKATKEIHHSVDPHDPKENLVYKAATLGEGAAIVQILMLDLVFSIDSIITAVGMTDHLAIMFIAVITAVTVMLIAAEPLSRFIAANPTVV